MTEKPNFRPMIPDGCAIVQEVELTADAHYVRYKGKPILNNEFYQKLMSRGFLIHSPEDYPTGAQFQFIVQTPVANDPKTKDHHFVGCWNTLLEAQQWLEHPDDRAWLHGSN